jgi:isocitrate dehydrogenase kinase/phosphatase
VLAETQFRLNRAYARLEGCSAAERVAAVAELILAIFDHFYCQLCEYPYRAKRAFEAMDPHAAIQISAERLGLYSRYIGEHGPRIRVAYPELSSDEAAWAAIDRLFVGMIADRYEADIAFSFAHSLRRNIGLAIWRPVAYSFPPPSKSRALSMAQVYRRFAVGGRIEAGLLCEVLQTPDFATPFRDLESDAEAIRARIERLFAARSALSGAPVRPVWLDVVQAGFYRDRSAFLVARWVCADESVVPFVVGYLNGPDGVYADAVLDAVSDIHDLFSSTLANLHVTTRLYYQTCVFLFSLMPRRPLGHHYSTIGYNHVGKVAILNEIVEQIRASGLRLRRSPGATGTVALGFTFEDCSYHLKVIRDRPTKSYKWGSFPGVPAVVDKYREVHEINRAGSMLDNAMYFNLRLDLDLFEESLLAEICAECAGSAQLDADGLLLRSLIVQLKIVPLPVYLATADSSQTRAVVAALGDCIRNNAATNIFNRDLDSRNYGVGRYGRVFLFDYDAVERLTDVKIRTNSDLEPGEEGVPAWFFEEGVIFLPEELELGMQFVTEEARRCFRAVNADLLTVGYWSGIQRRLLDGEVPDLRIYPDAARLRADSPA